jgi:hypothetical protein
VVENWGIINDASSNKIDNASSLFFLSKNWLDDPLT